MFVRKSLRQVMLVLAAAAIVLAACDGFKEAMTAHVDVVARAGSQELSVTRLAELLGVRVDARQDALDVRRRDLPARHARSPLPLVTATVVRAVLEDYRTAPIPEKMRAMLAFLEKLTLRPAEVGPEDMEPLRAAGLCDEEIEDAIHVCANFNIINRMADSLGFRQPTREVYEGSARILLKSGYV